MMLNAPYPADIRVKKEADALIAAGFEVHLLCRRKSGERAEDTFEGIILHRIDAGTNNYQVAFWDVIISMTFSHPRFLSAARKIVREHSISIVHVHDLPLCGTALKLKGKEKISVILDMHENYPEALRTWFSWKKNPVVRLKNTMFMNPGRWTQLERRACMESDRIIAVVEEMKSRIVEHHGIDAEKIVVVTNTEDKNFLAQEADTDIYGSLKGKFILAYSGGIGPHRGVDVAIKGMSHLKDNTEIQLVVVGFGSASVMNSLHRLVRSLGLTNVHFLGYQPFRKFYSYMHEASVNVIPHQSNLHTDNTVPHKLFQGMMAGRPLLVSSSAPLKRLVEQHKSGLVFKAGDAQDFADKVNILFADKALADKLGESGRKATVNGDLNWENTQVSLVNLYKSVGSPG